MEEFLTKFDSIFKTGKEHLQELKRYLMFLESPLCDPEKAKRLRNSFKKDLEEFSSD